MWTSSASASRLAARRQLLDGQIDLVGDEEVQAEDVVRRLARAPAIDPRAVAQLVALPRLADRQADEQRDERGEQRRVRAHHARASRRAARSGTTRRRRPSGPARGGSARSTRARRRRRPPRWLTQCTRDRTSATASAGAADSPTRASTAQVDDVVAHVRDVGVARAPVSARICSYVSSLLGDALVHERDAELRGAVRSWSADVPRRQEADREAGALRPDDGDAVPDVERLALGAVARGCRTLPSVSTPSTSNSSSLTRAARAVRCRV